MPRLVPLLAVASALLFAAAASAAPNEAGDGAAPAPQPVPSPAPPVAEDQGTPATVLDTQGYDGLLGKSVRAMNGDDLGRIIDVIIDRDGRPRAAIIDFGGFLGVGSRKIAVDWRVLKFSVDGRPGRLTLMLNRDQVRVSPEYKPGEPIVVLGASSPPAVVPEGEPAAAKLPERPAPERPPEKTPDR